MKKILILLMYCIGIAAMELKGQVLINPQVPLAGLVVKSQLWYLSLVNNNGRDEMVQLEMTLTDLAGKQQVLSAVSKAFMLHKGIKQIQPAEIMPITYTVQNSAYPVDANPNGFLPVGQFTVCYRVIRIDGGSHEPASEQCVEVQIEPLSPPILISPADSEQVQLPRPQFTWLPPAANSLFGRMMYELHVVEVQGNQTAAEAIQQNIPLFVSSHILNTNWQYPLSSPALDTGKVYAWQVVASNNSVPIATSESWAFSIKKPTANTIQNFSGRGGYEKLSREKEAAFSIAYGLLRYQYLEESNDSVVQCVVKDITNSRNIEVVLDSAMYKVKYGDNLLELDLRKTSGMINKHIYLFELINNRNEHWYVKFEYRKPD